MPKIQGGILLIWIRKDWNWIAGTIRKLIRPQLLKMGTGTSAKFLRSTVQFSEFDGVFSEAGEAEIPYHFLLTIFLLPAYRVAKKCCWLRLTAPFFSQQRVIWVICRRDSSHPSDEACTRLEGPDLPRGDGIGGPSRGRLHRHPEPCSDFTLTDSGRSRVTPRREQLPYLKIVK